MVLQVVELKLVKHTRSISKLVFKLCFFFHTLVVIITIFRESLSKKKVSHFYYTHIIQEKDRAMVPNIIHSALFR
jgi:hypothetical protein